MFVLYVVEPKTKICCYWYFNEPCLPMLKIMVDLILKHWQSYDFQFLALNDNNSILFTVLKMS